MTEDPRREFGRDGISGLVDWDRALRAKLLPPRQAPAPVDDANRGVGPPPGRPDRRERSK